MEGIKGDKGGKESLLKVDISENSKGKGNNYGESVFESDFDFFPEIDDMGWEF